MERDLILGYVSIKLTSFLAMALHSRDEPAGLLWIAACVAGFAGGALLLAQAWRKARALVNAPAIDEPSASPVMASEAKPSGAEPHPAARKADRQPELA